MFGRRYARYQGTRFKILRSHVVTSVPRSRTDTAETTLRQSTGMTFWMTRSFRRRAFSFIRWMELPLTSETIVS